MYEYLEDIEFLQKLDKMNLRTHYAKIILLSFNEEDPEEEIQGIITSGNLTVNGSSAVRRTISLSMLANENNSKIDMINKDQQISINKKVRIEIGLKNILKDYQNYGELNNKKERIVWFPCGTFILSAATVSRSTSGWNISISGKDKMCLLDGTVGGMLPASVTFHEKLIMQDNGDIEIQYPTLFQIIFEAVNHWGGEKVENIIITDIDEQIKMLVRYMGDTPIYFSNNYESMSFTPRENFPHMYTYGEDAGYKMTDFTYPGELILKAGDSVVTLLDKICDILGNFEYFYTVDGKFVFQEIKNYLNTGSPLTELTENDYVKSYNNAKFLYSLTDLDTTTTITKNPKYDNLKNDFYVWGKRTTTSGIEVDIRYHLAIDEKPYPVLSRKYMWEIKDKDTGLIVRYDFTDEDVNNESGYEATLISTPTAKKDRKFIESGEWREELYRRALNAQVTNSVYDNYYDSELIAEWRGLYDPMKEQWNSTKHWNPDVFEDPAKINFWLDFIDTGSELGKYSISQIGRRTKVVNNNDIKTVYNSEVPDIVFFEGHDQDLIVKYQGIGQRYFMLTDQNYDLFSISTTGASCFDKIREMIYQNLNYNTTISLTCLPKYYMEPNNIIFIEDRETGISGNYQITQFSLPLTYNGTMNITATEVLTRV